MAHRLEPGAELRHRLAHALGDGAHLAVLGGQQHDDAVGLAELVRAQHDAVVAVQVADAHRVRVEPAEAAAAAVEVVDRGLQIGRPDSSVGTIAVDEHQLAVGQLPHQRRRQPVGGPSTTTRSGSTSAGSYSAAAIAFSSIELAGGSSRAHRLGERARGRRRRVDDHRAAALADDRAGATGVAGGRSPGRGP